MDGSEYPIFFVNKEILLLIYVFSNIKSGCFLVCLPIVNLWYPFYLCNSICCQMLPFSCCEKCEDFTTFVSPEIKRKYC